MALREKCVLKRQTCGKNPPNPSELANKTPLCVDFPTPQIPPPSPCGEGLPGTLKIRQDVGNRSEKSAVFSLGGRPVESAAEENVKPGGFWGGPLKRQSLSFGRTGFFIRARAILGFLGCKSVLMRLILA